MTTTDQTVPELPPGLARAKTYASIFLNVGSNWRFYVPVDATTSGDEVYLQGVCMKPVDDHWELSTNGRTWTVKKATT